MSSVMIEARPHPTSGILRVLHADDDDSFRLLVRRTLSQDEELKAMCEVRLVPDGTNAVDYMLGEGAYADRDEHPLPHLVVLDQRMVRMDGIEALKRIKSSPSVAHIPVFVLTTSEQESLIHRVESIPGALCISKPLDFSEFRTMYAAMIAFASRVLALPRRTVGWGV